MINLQEVQVQITEMIKSDYPNPIFKVVDHNKMIFQFDDPSFHGESEIEVYKDSDGDVILFQGYGSTIDDNCQTVEEFMESFKRVYELEQEMLVEFSAGRI